MSGFCVGLNCIGVSCVGVSCVGVSCVGASCVGVSCFGVSYVGLSYVGVSCVDLSCVGSVPLHSSQHVLWACRCELCRCPHIPHNTLCYELAGVSSVCVLTFLTTRWVRSLQVWAVSVSSHSSQHVVLWASRCELYQCPHIPHNTLCYEPAGVSCVSVLTFLITRCDMSLQMWAMSVSSHSSQHVVLWACRCELIPVCVCQKLLVIDLWQWYGFSHSDTHLVLFLSNNSGEIEQASRYFSLLFLVFCWVSPKIINISKYV